MVEMESEPSKDLEIRDISNSAKETTVAVSATVETSAIMTVEDAPCDLIPTSSIATEIPAPTPSLPSIVPSLSLPSAAPSLSVPSIAPSSTLPSIAPSSSLPSVAPSSTLPFVDPALSLPSVAPSSTLPSVAPSLSLPSVTPSCTLPSVAHIISLPSAAPSSSLPSVAPSPSSSSITTSLSLPSISPFLSLPSVAPSSTLPSIAPPLSLSSVAPPSINAIPAVVSAAPTQAPAPTPPPTSSVKRQKSKTSENVPANIASDVVPDTPVNKEVLSIVMQVLKKYNLKETEEILKKEARLSQDVVTSSETDISKILSSYKSEGNPAIYTDAYNDLLQFVEGSLDIYKHELSTILYPLFAHVYLKMVFDGFEKEAYEFLRTFRVYQEPFYQNDIRKLSTVRKQEFIANNELAKTFLDEMFTVRISRDTVSMLKRHLKEMESKYGMVVSIIKQHLYFDMYEGAARNKNQIMYTSGALMGEAKRDENRCKIYYGLPKEPDLQAFLPTEEEDENEPSEGGDKPKKKKAKRDPLLNRKTKSDPNAPPPDRMPFPELKDSEKMEKVKALRESSKRVTLNAETMPSICSYTVMHARSAVCCAEICEDGTILGIGMSNSKIKLFSLVPQKLKTMKSAEQLQDIALDADDVMQRIMDDRSAESEKMLQGHSGPVYKLSFSPDRTLLLSCSEDATIRLWSLILWHCLVVYKGHLFPVWDVDFSPYGYYFASCGHDKTARLWATDNHQPLRLFVGHYSDVQCVKFHPNSNYIASGSGDRTVRLWDCVTGQRVRLMTGHKGSVEALCFSVDGRFLVSGGTDGDVLAWDLAHGHLLAVFSGHTSMISCLAFSRDGNILASGSLDCSMKIWDFTRLTEDTSLEDINVCHNPEIKTNTSSYLLRTFQTKQSPLLFLFFTRRNVLFSVGSYDGTYI